MQFSGIRLYEFVTLVLILNQQAMEFKLSPLPYICDALEPLVSCKTVEFHYTKHHQGYVNNLNKLVEGTRWAKKSLEDIIRKAEGPIFNNAAQVWNHTFYWEGFIKKGRPLRDGKLLFEINRYFGSFDNFKEQFSQAAISLFVSGLVWLVKEKGGALKIIQGPNAWNPIREKMKPLLTCDVWEHAYYLDYQNRRADYVAAFWSVVNWERIEQRIHG